MVATPSLMTELSERGFGNLGMWTRGVDVDLFRPDRAIDLDFPRPIFMTVGRVAVEKNLPAFLSLDLPGSKVVIGAGPQEGELKRRFPAAKFLGQLDNGILAAHLAAADVFVFPSRTDTFGVVQLEALASGVPIAAFPVTGPKDVIGNNPIGVLNEDLRVACMQALWISRESCREFALHYSWENSARQFIGHARKIAQAPRPKPRWRSQSPKPHLTQPGNRWCRVATRGSRMSTLSDTDLDNQTVTKAYARWAPVYDLVFGAVFERGRHAAIAAAERLGGRILEVGVGTGISLPHYSKNCRLCGVDISAPMLRKAQERVTELGLSNVEGLWVMDAEHLSFPDNSFDVVVAQYVITTVPNPEATLDEFARVLKPGGEIVLVSRVGAEAGLRRSLEHWFQPAARKLGWRTEFSFERYSRWAGQATRHATHRAPPHAAARTLLSDPLRQGRRRGARLRNRAGPRRGLNQFISNLIADGHATVTPALAVIAQPDSLSQGISPNRHTEIGRLHDGENSKWKTFSIPCAPSAGTIIATITIAGSTSRSISSAR